VRANLGEVVDLMLVKIEILFFDASGSCADVQMTRNFRVNSALPEIDIMKATLSSL
jgi:hypothetical protein